ncbi:hypothetical protein SDC9_157410 [bioreactor metagenome]|uniref:Uncharacterized protein n=1 Tax=bioreactor metagenome TaxID=1076179 RepID=A0A645F7C3_9ZZZZ
MRSSISVMLPVVSGTTFTPSRALSRCLRLLSELACFTPSNCAIRSVSSPSRARCSVVSMPFSSSRLTTRASREPNDASMLLFVSTTGALDGMNTSVEESIFSLPTPTRLRTETRAHTVMMTASRFTLYPISSLYRVQSGSQSPSQSILAHLCG